MATITILDTSNMKSAAYEVHGIDIEEICNELKKVGGSQLIKIYEHL